MIGLLRFLGIANAAVWFGSSLFFTLVVGPAVFSSQMLTLFGAAGPDTAKFYAGSVAQILFEGYFTLHHWCGALALIYLLSEWLLTGRPLQRLTLGLALAIFCLGLAGGFLLQPRMQQWHKIKYKVVAPIPPLQVEQAARSFRIWHGIAQAGNLASLIGLGVVLWRISQPNGAARYMGRVKYSLE